MSEKHTMPSYLVQLEQEVRELKDVNEHLRDENERLTRKVAELYEGAEEQKQRIHRLIETGDAMTRAASWVGMFEEVNAWRKAKEAKL